MDTVERPWSHPCSGCGQMVTEALPERQYSPEERGRLAARLCAQCRGQSANPAFSRSMQRRLSVQRPGLTLERDGEK